MSMAARIARATQVDTRFADGSAVPVRPGTPWTLVSRTGGGSAPRVDRLVARLGTPQRHLVVPAGLPTWRSLRDVHLPADTPAPIVACGGGSVLDAAKVFRLLDHERHRNADDAVLDGAVALPPLVCVPTTCGSGAEQTPTASLWDDGRKRALDGPSLRPSHAVYDLDMVGPDWDEPALAAAWDAIAHAIESLWSTRATDMSIDLARTGLARLATGIAPAPYVDWRALQEGAAFAAGGIALTRTGVAHALSYPLTIRHDCPHGLAAGLWTVALAPRMIAGDAPLARALADALGTDLPVATLDRLWQATGAAAAVDRYVTRADIAAIGLGDLDPVRGQASRRRIDAADLAVAGARAMLEPAG